MTHLLSNLLIFTFMTQGVLSSDRNPSHPNDRQRLLDESPPVVRVPYIPQTPRTITYHQLAQQPTIPEAATSHNPLPASRHTLQHPLVRSISRAVSEALTDGTVFSHMDVHDEPCPICRTHRFKTEPEDDEKAPIRLSCNQHRDDLEDPESNAQGHMFHYGCIQDWARQLHRTCPTCRQEISQVDLDRLNIPSNTDERPTTTQNPQLSRSDRCYWRCVKCFLAMCFVYLGYCSVTDPNPGHVALSITLMIALLAICCASIDWSLFIPSH